MTNNADCGLPVWKSCYTCQDYLSDVEKRLTLADRLGEKAKREGREPTAVVDEFMEAAHERHLTGEPLREGGPTRVTDPFMGRLAALLASVTTPAVVCSQCGRPDPGPWCDSCGWQK